jgi:ATP-dependent Clp protease adaptor protein ClpS
MSTPIVSPQREAETEERSDQLPDEQIEADRPWVTVVWNDPVNLMSYVTHVLMKVFGYPKSKATALMLDVHHKGKAIVSSGPREHMEGYTATLQGYGLWATIQRDS